MYASVNQHSFADHGIPRIEIVNKVFQNDEAEPWWKMVIGGDIYEDSTPR